MIGPRAGHVTDLGDGGFMRSVIGGLLGLCLLAALAPADANARTDPRGSAQAATSSSRGQAVRPAAPRASSARPAMAPRQAASQRAPATSSRQAAARPSSGSVSVPNRPGSSSRLASGRVPPRRSVASPAAVTRHAAAVPYGRQAAAVQPLRQTAMATCTTRNGRRTCGSPTRSASLPWTGGLTPAAMSQAGCPDGTIATNALGHSDIVRCVPL